MKKSVICAVISILCAGNAFNINAMTEGGNPLDDKEAPQIKYCYGKLEEQWFKENQQKNSESENSFEIVPALARAQYFFVQDPQSKRNEYDQYFNVCAPKYMRIKGRYVSKATMDALLAMTVTEIPPKDEEAEDGQMYLTRRYLEVNMLQLEKTIIDRWLEQEALRDKKSQPTQQANHHHFWRGAAAGALATVSVASVGVGAWYYFNRNR